jgi:squalene-hopene/tetraprenyl-beta-curcumene cyclase
MIDPSTEDVTARVLECLGCLGWEASHPAIKQGLRYLEEQQTEEGGWYGRWGVNYIYGTSGVLRALETLGLSRGPQAQRGRAWLESVQNADGGFGESCASYSDPRLKGQGPSTPSQTAWGLIGLLATGGVADPAVERAVQYLLNQQKPEGSWDEEAFTGTGFPRVFYLRYHLYRNSFPLYALARYSNLLRSSSRFEALRFSPKDFRGHNGNGRKR